MPTAKVTLRVEGDSFTAMSETIRYTARNVNRDFGIRRRTVDAKALRWLRYTPASPKYPIDWQTPKQRRAFFATNGFGKGIPTQRTGKLQEEWAIILTPNPTGGELSFDNGAAHSPYVQGDVQQRMHIASGYHNVNDGVDMFAPEYIQTLENSFFAVGL